MKWYSYLPFLDEHTYERYLPTAFDESMTLLQKVNKVIEGLNTVIQAMNKTFEEVDKQNDKITAIRDDFETLKEWLENEGLQERTVWVLNEWFDSGKLATIIAEEVFDMKVDKSTFEQFVITTNQQLDHVVKNGVNIEQFGAAANDPSFDNRQAFVDAFNYLTALGGGVLYVNDLYYTTANIYIPSNTIVDGLNVGEVKIKADTGNYWAVFWVKDESNVIIRNIKVNQNVSENTSTNIDISELQNPLANIYVNGAENVLIDNCELNICGVWGIIADAHNENIRVTNCNVHFIEGNSNYELYEHMKFDNTAVFVDAKTSIVSGNIITTDNYRGESAIEIHRCDGIAEKNTIRGYRTGIILCPALYEYDDKSQLTLQATNNKMYNVIKGVVLWAYDVVDTDNIIVSGNQIELAGVRHNSPRVHGIFANLVVGSDHLVVYRNININNNIIIFEDDLRVYDDPDIAVNHTGISLTGWHNIYNFSVSNNTIINAGGVGIVVGGSADYTVDGGDITNNTIINAGSNINISGSFRSAIVALGNHKNISIGKNTIIDRRQSGTFYTQPLLVLKQNATNTISVSPQNIHDGVNVTQSYLYNWMPVEFENGYTLGAGSRPVAYIKDENGFVHLRGSIVVGTNGERAFSLPKGYRADNYNKDTLTIIPSGVYSYAGSGNTEYLDGIVFLAEE